MSDLVERTCQVLFNERLDAVFYHLDGDEDELWSEYELSEDDDMRNFVEALHDPETRVCGAPANHYVDYGEDRVWMCDLHYDQCIDGGADLGAEPSASW